MVEVRFGDYTDRGVCPGHTKKKRELLLRAITMNSGQQLLVEANQGQF
jgi:hypothetical protein